MGVSEGTLRLGSGAGFAGDRLDPAVELVRHGELDYMALECLGERTVAAGHARRIADPGTGYDPLLRTRLRGLLPETARTGTRLLTNAGAANPEAAAQVAIRTAREVGVPLRVALVTGDDVLAAVREADPVLWETGEPLSAEPGELISANAYIGHEPLVEALETGAGLVLCGRVADPSLFLAPLVHRFGWDPADADLLGAGTVVGHLLECAGQLTGGYFADPVTKPVPDLARLGFPFADVSPDGSAVLGKVDGTGGRLDRRTCAEQLLYEVGDPSSYVTPDVVADFSGVRFEEVGRDRVRVDGGAGSARPDRLKVTLGFRGGWLGEGQISYAGPRALERAQLAAEVATQRLERVHGLDPARVGIELLGAGAAFRGLAAPGSPAEVRVRVSALVPTREEAHAVGWEVESLYTNGPAGGGGARTDLRENVSVRSCLLDRDLARPHVEVIS